MSKVIVGLTHISIEDYCDHVIEEEFKNKIPTSEIRRIQNESRTRYKDVVTRKQKNTVTALERSVSHLKTMVVVMFLLFGITIQAQVPINGTISGTCSKPCYSTQYDSVTQSMTQLPFEVASFPNWEVWTKNGYVYVIRKAKQRFSFLSYAKFNCIVLQLPKSIPQEELVTR